MLRRCASAVQALFAIVVTSIMLVPTGMCVCAEHDDESPSEQHEPGCPKVRTLDRDQPPTSFVPDFGLKFDVEVVSNGRQIGISAPVPQSGRSPPGLPIHMVCRSLLI